MNVMQADIVARSDGTIGLDQLSLCKRGHWPMTSKQYRAMARVPTRTDDDATHLVLLTQIDRAPERRHPLLRQAHLRLPLSPVEAFLRSYPPEKIEAFITAMDVLTQVCPHVKARGIAPQNSAPAGR